MLSCNAKAALAMGIALVMLYATWTETYQLKQSRLFSSVKIKQGE